MRLRDTIVRCVGKGSDESTPHPIGPASAKLGAAGVPAVDAAGLGTDPDEA